MSTPELYRELCSPTARDYKKWEDSVFLTSIRALGILDGWSVEAKKYFYNSGHKLAAKAHVRQKRYDGSPYIIHPEGGCIILQQEILLPQGKSLTPSQGVRILNHDVPEDCPKFLERLYNELTPRDFASIAHISKINDELWKFLSNRVFSSVFFILSNTYAHRLVYLQEQILREMFFRRFQEGYPSIDWSKYDLQDKMSLRRLAYGISLLTNPAWDNTIKTPDAVYNLRDSDYLRDASPEKRKKRKEKIQFFREFLLTRLREDANSVEYNLLLEAIEYAEDHLRKLENPSVGVISSMRETK